MGKLTFATLILLPLTCLASELPQAYKDGIREHHTQRILGTSEEITNLQPDVRLYRELFKKPNVVDRRETLPPDPVPWAQLFKGSDLTLGEVITLVGGASGYDPKFDPQVNQNQLVKLNSHPNSLADVAEYLTRVTDAHVMLYPDSRTITVTRKVR